MIESAAVKILDKRDNVEKILPCHRHCDAYDILHMLNIPYETIQEGFLTETGVFFDRKEAADHARYWHQIQDDSIRSLFSEDLW